MSAAGRAILAQKQKEQEEEAKYRAKLAEEERKIREEEERIAAEERRVAEEKERKRKAKQDKIEAQKAAGTFMTKAEKEKERKRLARLEAMGIDPNAPVRADAGQSKPASQYTKKKPNKAPVAKTSESSAIETEEGANVPITNTVDEASEDDWDSNDFAATSVAAKISGLVVSNSTVEDKLELEQIAEQERLKVLGIERLKREEEARIKKYCCNMCLIFVNIQHSII